MNKKSSSNTTKKIAQAQKIIDIARRRRIHISEVLEYDLISKSYLLDNDYTSTSKPDKYVLVKKLEKKKKLKQKKLLYLQRITMQTSCH